RVELVAETSVVALQVLELSCRHIRLRSPPLWGERRLIGHVDQLAPGGDHGGVDALAAHERSERPSLFAAISLGKQPALLASGELAAFGDRNDLRITARRFLRGHLSSKHGGLLLRASHRTGHAGPHPALWID